MELPSRPCGRCGVPLTPRNTKEHFLAEHPADAVLLNEFVDAMRGFGPDAVLAAGVEIGLIDPDEVPALRAYLRGEL